MEGKHRQRGQKAPQNRSSMPSIVTGGRSTTFKSRLFMEGCVKEITKGSVTGEPLYLDNTYSHYSVT